MEKDFAEWHALKTLINNELEKRLLYSERDIWWMNIGNNIGFEEDGKGKQYARPVLILRGFSKELFLGVPLSTTKKRGEYYYEFTATGGTKLSVALLSQIRAYDTKRFIDKYGFVSERDFKIIKLRIMKMILK